jgi:hypothetical protein
MMLPVVRQVPSVTINQPAQALAATYTTVNANCNVPTASVTVTPQQRNSQLQIFICY